MKVEKCPLCDIETAVASNHIIGRFIDIPTHYTAICGCHQENGTFKWLAILRYNRWARHEARRIKRVKK